MKAKYLCESWAGMIQQIVYIISRGGYYFYHVEYLPEKKKEKWLTIDQKLIAKYQTDKTKWQRLAQKEKGLANFIYIRWSGVAIIFRSAKGDIPEDINCDDKFNDVRKKPIKLQISDMTGFVITYKEKVDVELDEQTFNGLKLQLADVARIKNPFKMKLEFNKVNGFPAWAGIIRQKRELAKYLVRQAAKHQVKLAESSLRLVDKRFPVKVWFEEGTEPQPSDIESKGIEQHNDATTQEHHNDTT